MLALHMSSEALAVRLLPAHPFATRCGVAQRLTLLEGLAALFRVWSTFELNVLATNYVAIFLGVPFNKGSVRVNLHCAVIRKPG